MSKPQGREASQADSLVKSILSRGNSKGRVPCEHSPRVQFKGRQRLGWLEREAGGGQDEETEVRVRSESGSSLSNRETNRKHAGGGQQGGRQDRGREVGAKEAPLPLRTPAL